MQFPLPRYASDWMDVPTTTSPLASYEDCCHDGVPPPLPEIAYSLAFALRHGMASPLGRAPPAHAGGARLQLSDAAQSADDAAASPSRRISDAASAPAIVDISDHGGRPSAERGSERDALANGSAPPAAAAPAAEGAPPPKRKSSKRRSSASRALPPPVSIGMCGMSADECALLLEHGHKPWDEDAEEVLAALLKRRSERSSGTLV
jgi:hypothetical protein